jgi:hypothetical protein
VVVGKNEEADRPRDAERHDGAAEEQRPRMSPPWPRHGRQAFLRVGRGDLRASLETLSQRRLLGLSGEAHARFEALFPEAPLI